MDFGFLNVWMLLGLAGVALPVLAHLISKRRFDVVYWGAMRFLELGQRSRRHIRLQDILLLLIRMSLLALVAVSLARPWGSGVLGGWAALPPRDFVFILDGSGSLAWQNDWGRPGKQDQQNTPRQQAVEAMFALLEKLNPEDTVTLIEARSRPQRLTASPTTNRKQIRDALTGIAGPAGSSNIPEAIEEGLKILSATPNANLSQRIVLFTDNQALAWQPQGDVAWSRIDELQKQTRRAPRLQALTFGPREEKPRNFSIGPIELSREITVPEFPIRIRALLRQSGGDAPSRQKVTLEINGQKIPGKTAEIDLLPEGEALVEFEHSFPALGHFLARISLEPDALPEDNASQTILTVTDSIPVLLVDGDWQADPTRRETFYLQSLFASSGSQSPWIKATIVRPDGLQEAALRDQQVVFLCNVSSLTARQWTDLRKFVSDGGGLVIAPGNRTQPDDFNSVDAQEPLPFLPARLRLLIDEQSVATPSGVTVDSTSLEVPWLQRFRQENGFDLVRTRFQKWYRLEPALAAAPPATPEKPTGVLPERQGSPENTEPQILARLSQRDPWLIERRFGSGTVLQLASPLDADWSTLPAKNDFVPFIHELVFSLTAHRDRRNIPIGSPLLLPLKKNEAASQFVASGPGIDGEPVEFSQQGQIACVRFRRTDLPGLYFIHKKGEPKDRGERFVVDDDHRESDLTPLSAENWKSLEGNGRISRIESIQEAVSPAAGEAPQTEFWWLLLVGVLVLLLVETALTRKMVQGGHAAVEAALES